MFATLDSQTEPLPETLVRKNIRISQISVNSGLAGMVINPLNTELNPICQ